MRRYLATVAAVALLGVSGCDDEPDGPPPLEVTPNSEDTETSQTESSDPPVDPTTETAREFLRRWVEVGNEAVRTGDTAILEEITTSECRSCADLLNSIHDVYHAGGFIRSRGERVTSIESHYGRTEWNVGVRAFPTRYRESASAPIKRLPPGSFRYRVQLEKDASGWRVSFYAVIDE